MKNLLSSLCLLFSLQSFAQPTSGLVAHYTFNGNASDVSGHGNHGILHGATLATDQLGNPNHAYSFNGTSNYIELPNNILHLNNYSYSICVKPVGFSPSSTLFAIGNSTADQYVFLANQSPYFGFGAASYYALSPTVPDRLYSDTLPALNSFYHVLVTRSNTALKLFVNGVFIDSVTVHTAIPSYGTGTTFTRIGCRDGNTEFFKGVIDDVAIYDHALTDAEIQNYSCSYTGPSLVGCYPLDNNALDFSGNNYNGTAFSMTGVADRFGHPNGACHFSGTGSYVAIPASGYLLNDYTYSLWCRLTSISPGDVQNLFSIGGAAADQAIQIGNNPGRLGFGTASYTPALGSYGCRVGALPVLNQWYHVVMTRTNTTTSLFVDGIFICDSTYSATNAGYLNNPLSGTIGARVDFSGQNFRGDMDDVRIYNRALTPAEVQNMPLSCSCTPIPLNMSHDTSICDGSIISLHASGATNYQWNPPTGLSSTTGSLVLASPHNSITYSVIGTDSLTGCLDSSTVTLTVNQLPVQPAIIANGMNLASSTVAGATYQWNFFGHPIAGATSQFYTADSTGFFTVTVTDPVTGCSATSNPSFVFISAVGENYIDNSMVIFPNPAGDKFTIEMSLPKSQKQISVKLFNTIGESVLSQFFSDVQPGSLNKQFNTGNLQSGVYMLQIKLEDGALVSRKIVIQK